MKKLIILSVFLLPTILVAESHQDEGVVIKRADDKKAEEAQGDAKDEAAKNLEKVKALTQKNRGEEKPEKEKK